MESCLAEFVKINSGWQKINKICLPQNLGGRQTALCVPAVFNHRCDAALVPSGAGMGLHCAEEENGQNELQGSSAESPFPLLSPCPKATICHSLVELAHCCLTGQCCIHVDNFMEKHSVVGHTIYSPNGIVYLHSVENYRIYLQTWNPSGIL